MRVAKKLKFLYLNKSLLQVPLWFVPVLARQRWTTRGPTAESTTSETTEAGHLTSGPTTEPAAGGNLASGARGGDTVEDGEDWTRAHCPKLVEQFSQQEQVLSNLMVKTDRVIEKQLEEEADTGHLFRLMFQQFQNQEIQQDLILDEISLVVSSNNNNNNNSCLALTPTTGEGKNH